MKYVHRIFMVLAVALLVPAMAQAVPTVEVTFGKGLADTISAIDRVEAVREERFRRTLDDTYRPNRGERRLANSLVGDIIWGGEIAVPELENFNVENLVAGLVRESLVRANVEFDGTIRVQIDRIRVTNHSVGRISNGPSYVKGSFTLIDSSGREVANEQITANLVLGYSANYNYDGPGFPYTPSDPDNRVAPALTYFVKRGLEAVFPGTEMPRPIVIRFERF